MYDPSFFVWK